MTGWSAPTRSALTCRTWARIRSAALSASSHTSAAGRGEAGKIGKQNNRRDDLELAAANLAREDPAPGFRADVGIQEVDRDLVAEPGLHRKGEARQEMAQD